MSEEHDSYEGTVLTAMRTHEEIMAEANGCDDWRGTCRCGLVRVGTVGDLLQPCPRCGAQ